MLHARPPAPHEVRPHEMGLGDAPAAARPAPARPTDAPAAEFRAAETRAAETRAAEFRAPEFRASSAPDGSMSLIEGLDLLQMLKMLRRSAKIIAVCALVGLTLAVAYASVAPAKFTATTTLMIGTRPLRAVQDISEAASPMLDATLVDSQIEVLDSERVLLATVRSLGLTRDPEFIEPDFFAPVLSWVRWLANPAAWFRPPGPPSDPAYRLERVALSRLNSAIKVSRVGKSNVVNLAVTVKDPRKASTIANAIAENYLADQLASRYDAARRATVWFQQRIDELRDQSVAAQAAVERFRASNNLLATGGQLVSDQQLGQINTELASARADRVRKEARFESLRSIVASGQTDALVSEALDSSVVSQLRTRAAEASRRLNEIQPRLGPQHESVQNLRKQISEFQRLIFEELRRIESTYRNDFEVALERERSLERSAGEFSTVAVTNNASLIQLRQLEGEAASLKALHQTLLQRSQEALQQGSLPINDARIVSEAAPPLSASEPRTSLLSLIGLVLGLGAGVAVAGVRELSDRTFRSPRQVEDELGLAVLGTLARVEDLRAEPRRKMKGDGPLRKIGGPPRAPVGEDGGAFDISRYTVTNPFSSYAETFRSLKIALETRFEPGRGKVIGIVSALPQEGKSVVARNFASLLALHGARAALVDADLRQAGLTRLLKLEGKPGLTEALVDERPLDELLLREEDTGLTLLPASAREDFYLSGELVGSAAMAGILKTLAASHDYVILDLPPLAPVTDAEAISKSVNAFLMVVAWGDTPAGIVKEALESHPSVYARTFGVLLNKVDLKRFRFYKPAALNPKQTEAFNRYYR